MKTVENGGAVCHLTIASFSLQHPGQKERICFNEVSSLWSQLQRATKQQINVMMSQLGLLINSGIPFVTYNHLFSKLFNGALCVRGMVGIKAKSIQMLTSKLERKAVKYPHPPPPAS